MTTRFSHRLYRIFSSTHYWVERRFTNAGALVLLGIFLTMGLAVDTEQSAAYQLLGVLGCLLLSAMIWAPFFRGRFSVQRHLPRFGTVHEPLRYNVTIVNLGRKPQRELLFVEEMEDRRPTFQEFKRLLKSQSRGKGFRIGGMPRGGRAVRMSEVAVKLVPAHGTAEVHAELIPLRRGPLRFKAAFLARSDPLGLFRGFVRICAAETVLILPKRYLLPPLALPGATKYQQGGVALAGSVGESEEFVSLREYRRGDPLRHIHWKSWAKTGEPIVKEFQDEFFVRHALILDTFAGPEKSEAFEEAVSIAASFASNLQTQESLLDLMFVGPQAFCFTAGRGVAHAEQMLEILASVSLCETKPFRNLHDLVVKHTMAVSGCVCIFLAWDGPRRELVRHLKQLQLPLLVLVVQEKGNEQELDPGPLQDEPECLHACRVGNIAEALQKLA